MNYIESVAYIESLIPTLEHPTLERITLFMQEEGNFHARIKCFQVGGTNGKGSTATILDALVWHFGYKVGRFTGPHIMRFNERFSVSGKTISDRRFAEIATLVHERSHQFAANHPNLGRLTWFEFLTAMAFFYFKEENVDYAVLEVGLGGRFDATSVASNVIGTIITNIDLDHTHILGDTVEKIAFEKAGIMRNNIPVFTFADEKAIAVFNERARAVHTSVMKPGGLSSDLDKALDELPLHGPHQRQNAQLAINCFMATEIYEKHSLTGDDLRKAFASIYFPGRMQIVSLANKNLIMDGAHNPAGARALRLALDGNFPGKHCFILGFYNNKDVPRYLEELVRTGDRVIAMQLTLRRSTFPKEQIASICSDLGVEASCVESMDEALKLAQAQSNEQMAEIVLTGSFATIKELMLTLGWQSVEHGRAIDNAALSNRY